MKKYILFYGDSYYPLGGWEDFGGTFDTVEKAKDYVLSIIVCDWWHIVDTETMEIVAHN